MISVAPMLDWTDRHCRFFHRQISQHALLYTEMVTTGAILHGRMDFLAYNEQEHPVALQLGGSDPADLARCARLAQERGYDEINLNVGCPSDRVQNGRFGACLMAEPQLVADCIAAMQDAAPNTPVTVKTRLGIDEHDSYEFLQAFLEPLRSIQCPRVILHARKAWLNGLSPKQNREVPPLNYERVYHAKRDYPDFEIHLNGGVETIEQARAHLSHVDGVMIGRAAYQNPWLLAEVDALVGEGSIAAEKAQVIQTMATYIESHIAQGGRFWHVARHMLGLFQACPGARQWRRHLSQQGPTAVDASPLWEAFAIVERETMRMQERAACVD
ncbi:tRNA dihydrouridine(20/20a) synthase DusA [Aliidiomarina halalkaliphila]|uniref:tRNA-dihydrouridine(20/20a) synthase n=1 Tax=Aliidiomarina halalkaliphila TaxID=2593535 RepID=A0A552WYZ6_9GAMM|nr:tRNA dihydrouridine(20/20a) synthase DusA [Aliidiomarina halalkaliphila]TRW47906.1 tRNA dihydrouridine(20/20a) synthase DusA [Aliidiomarina halalkaliphila]